MEKRERLVLKYPVLVEGKYDRIRLSNIVASPVLTADGFAVFNSPQKKKLLRRLTQDGKLILLTDSDAGGRLIRSKLKGYLPAGSTIDLYIPKIHGRERRKEKWSKEGLLGVEGMDDGLLYDLLSDYAAADEENAARGEIDTVRLYEDGFLGGTGSAERRRLLAAELGLPDDLSAKALLQAVNLVAGAAGSERAVRKVKETLETL